MATERAEFSRTAASADPLDVVEALGHVPALEKITKAEAAEFESLAARHNGGTVERGAFAAVAQRAADHNERRAAERQYPDNFGDLAASAYQLMLKRPLLWAHTFVTSLWQRLLWSCHWPTEQANKWSTAALHHCVRALLRRTLVNSNALLLRLQRRPLLQITSL
jgi:Seed maturation protein